MTAIIRAEKFGLYLIVRVPQRLYDAFTCFNVFAYSGCLVLLPVNPVELWLWPGAQVRFVEDERIYLRQH